MTNASQTRIAKTGFLTSAAAYVLFWLADAARPGFVARYVSVHLFLLAAIVFGVWWTLVVREYRDWPFVQYAAAGIFGILFATVAWRLGAGFESYRLLAVAAAAIAPTVVLSLVRSL